MAESQDKKFHYGGQAVIEGVMMRGPKDFAVAVRRANGEITSTTESVESILGKLKWLDKPFLRGTLALIDALALGIKALKYSADIAMQDALAAERGQDAAEDPPARPPSRVNDLTVGIIMVVGLAIGIGLFFLVPILIVGPATKGLVSWERTVLEGIVKISIFVLYVLAISLLPDIRRVFQYHGAEHKTINAFEAGEELTVENVGKYTKAHVRCGTSFLLVVIVTGIILFMFIPTWTWYLRFAYKLALLPVIAGIAYEVIRFAGNRKESLLTRTLLIPGLLTQKITTREPEPAMIEVAIRSLDSVIHRESAEQTSPRPGD